MQKRMRSLVAPCYVFTLLLSGFLSNLRSIAVQPVSAPASEDVKLAHYFLFSNSLPVAVFRGSEHNRLLTKVFVSVACWLMLTFSGIAQTCTVPSGSATISTSCSNVTSISGSQYNNGSLEITSTGSVGVSADAGNSPVAQAINISFGSVFAAYSFSNYGSIATSSLTTTGAPVNPVNIVGPGTGSTLSNFTNSGKIIATANKGGDGFTLVNLENINVNSFTNGTNGLISATWGG